MRQLHDPPLYVNHARISPAPPSVVTAIEDQLRRESIRGWSRDEEQAVVVDVRSVLAELIGAEAEEIALVQSATWAFNLLVNGLRWRPDDNVVVTDLLYRSIAHVLLRLRDEQQVSLRVVASEGLRFDPDSVASCVDEHTRLVVVPILPLFCGVPQPVAALRALFRSSDTFLVLNATQAAGQLPIDVRALGCDFLFGTSRKWLRGPRGLGFLYIRRSLIPTLRPSFVGYPAASWLADDHVRFADNIDRFRVGDYPYALLCGLAAAVRLAIATGIEQIASRNAYLGSLCRDRLASVGGVTVHDAREGVTGTVPITIAGLDADAVVHQLADHGVLTCALYEEDARLAFRKLGVPSLVRISLHHVNTVEDVERLSQTIEQIARCPVGSSLPERAS